MVRGQCNDHCDIQFTIFTETMMHLVYPPKFYINIVSVEFELQYTSGVFWALSRCLLLDDTEILLFFQKPTSDHREAVMLCLQMQFIQKTHCLKKSYVWFANETSHAALILLFQLKGKYR